MNEANAEQVSAEPGSVDAKPVAPTSSDAPHAPVTAAAQQSVAETAPVESPDLVPGQGESGETVAADAPEAEPAHAAKPEAPRVEAPKVEAPKPEAPRTTGKIMIMANDGNAWEGKAREGKAWEGKAWEGKAWEGKAWEGNDWDGGNAWESHGVGPETDSGQASGMFGKRRIAALAAVVALAMVAGAVGGALATASLGHFSGGDAVAAATTAGNQALEASVARIDSDVLALKTSVDHTSKLGMAQFNKTSERLDKLEKAQAEPAAKLAKLSEAVEKLHAAPPPAPAPVAAAAPPPAPAKDVTGSISPPAAAPAAAPKVEVARLPTVEGWLLRDVANGGAVIEGRQGIFEVYAGDPVPGLGRVDAIRRQDGRWVVVTSRGLIVAR